MFACNNKFETFAFLDLCRIYEYKRVFFPCKIISEPLIKCWIKLFLETNVLLKDDFTQKQWKSSESTAEIWKINGALRRSSATVHEVKASLPLLLSL